MLRLFGKISLSPKSAVFGTYRRSSTNKEAKPRASLVSKVGLLLGLAGLPVFSFVVYDRFAELPLEFKGLNFPLFARFYIRRALCPATSLAEEARYLDLAMQKVFNSGLGSASPESTALVLYLARQYLEAEQPSVPDLEAAYSALTFKPHVGEAIKEERARLELSFKICERLCQIYKSEKQPEKARLLAEKALNFMNNGPSYLKDGFANHPLRSVFNSYK